MLYSLEDYSIIPAAISNINSRSECSTDNNDGHLPLMCSPMSQIINDENYQTFVDSKVFTIIPRNIELGKRIELMQLNHNNLCSAFSLKEFIDITNTSIAINYCKMLIDCANGHMKSIYDAVLKAKQKRPNLWVMVGNIANPETYHWIIERKFPVDAIRLGIGGGSMCTSGSNTGIFYPMASLIMECNKIRKEYKKTRKVYNHHFDGNDEIFYEEDKSYTYPLLVADGGFNNFDQIIKALVMGVDYVMLGKIFAKTEEACGTIKYIINEYKQKIPVRDYYGMSTKKAQKEFGGCGNKTAEGISQTITIDYTLNGWLDNFNSYLKSAMSYCNAYNLDEFRENAKVELISQTARKSFYK